MKRYVEVGKTVDGSYFYGVTTITKEFTHSLSDLISQVPDIREKMEKILCCKDCGGNGYTAEHSGDMQCRNDDHSNCPVQVQCETCYATGFSKTNGLKSVDAILNLFKEV